MSTWINLLKDDPSPWLLEEDAPAVRHLALRQLLDQPENAPDVWQANAAAMQTDPIASILAAQQPEGFWVKPGPGYAPKYRGTVWQVIFLDQLGADGRNLRVQAACEYVLSHSKAETGGFAASGSEKFPPPPSGVIHCLNGNLLRALIGFGLLEDERVQHAIDWEQEQSLVKASAVITYRGRVGQDSVVRRMSAFPAHGEQLRDCWRLRVSHETCVRHVWNKLFSRE